MQRAAGFQHSCSVHVTQHSSWLTVPGTLHARGCEIVKVLEETELTERLSPAPQGHFCPGTTAGKPVLHGVREADG